MPPKESTIDADVAEAIELANLCEGLHVLPRAGGLFDQDSYHMWLINQVLMARNERAQLEQDRRNKQKPGK